MFSRRIVFRRNRFVHNRGFASVGLLLKACEDTLAEDNLIADNARGIFVEGSSRNVFRRNIVASSDVALVLYDSIEKNRFEGNSFVANMSPLMFVGRIRSSTAISGRRTTSPISTATGAPIARTGSPACSTTSGETSAPRTSSRTAWRRGHWGWRNGSSPCSKTFPSPTTRRSHGLRACLGFRVRRSGSAMPTSTASRHRCCCWAAECFC